MSREGITKIAGALVSTAHLEGLLERRHERESRLARKKRHIYIYGNFPKLRISFLGSTHTHIYIYVGISPNLAYLFGGVPVIRVIIFWDLY